MHSPRTTKFSPARLSFQMNFENIAGLHQFVPKKPKPFKLKDLPVYSKTLRKGLNVSKLVLGGKYFKPIKEESVDDDEDRGSTERNRGQSPGHRTIEWTHTPVFKQFALKLTEMESLTDSGLGLRRARRHLLDLSDPKIKKRLLEETLRNVYCETEIEYLIKIIKNKNYSERQDELQTIYDKAVDTLELLMIKMGLKESFERIFGQYL